MKVFIKEIDRDYNCWVALIEKDFKSLAEAQLWCNENKWSGSYYIIDVDLTKAVNDED